MLARRSSPLALNPFCDVVLTFLARLVFLVVLDAAVLILGLTMEYPLLSRDQGHKALSVYSGPQFQMKPVWV